MSDELVQHLKKQVADLTAETMKRKTAIRDLRAKLAEADPLRAQVTDLIADRDAWKVKAESSPGEQAARVKSLEGELRGLKITGKLADVAKTLAEGVTLDDAFKVVGFDPGSADPETLDTAELAKAWQTAKPGLFKPGAATAPDAPGGAQRPKLTTELPAGRGSPDTTGSTFTVRKSDTQDAAYMQQNQAKIAAASAAGVLRFVD